MGEASNPGPARQRGPEEILNELEATLTRLDSSDEEPLLRPVSGRNVVRRVSDAVERCIGDPVQVSRRVVLAPQSPGTPRSVQNCASNKFSILAADSTFEDCSVSQTIPATPHALDEAGVLGPSATLLDDLECDLTRVDTDQVRVESRQRVPCRPTVAMSQGSGSDTESLTDIVHQPTWRRLVLVSSREAAVQGAQREGDAVPREARAADFFIRDVARRVGAVPVGSPLPRQLRNQRWSPLNVPVMWAAAGVLDSNPVCEWLVTACGDIPEPVDFHGGIVSASVAARTGLQALRSVFREWGIKSEGDLTLWFRANGFPGAQVGNHISFSQSPGTHFVRSQRERRARRSVGVSLRGAHIASMHRGRQIGMTPRLSGPQGSTPVSAVHDPQNPHADSWSSLDQVDLGDVFSQRIPTLKSCPHFFRGRFRFSFSFALCERHRAREVGDVLAENTRVEVVWIDPDDVVASAQRFRVCWKRRVVQAR